MHIYVCINTGKDLFINIFMYVCMSIYTYVCIYLYFTLLTKFNNNYYICRILGFYSLFVFYNAYTNVCIHRYECMHMYGRMLLIEKAREGRSMRNEHNMRPLFLFFFFFFLSILVILLLF